MVCLLGLIVAWPGAAAGQADPPRDYSGLLSLYVENDLFLRSDDNYTSGVGVSWTSNDASAYRDRAFANRFVRAASFLPTIGLTRFRHFVAFTLGQEIYTPADISSPDAPPDQQPYAGVLYLDSSVFSLGRRTMHAFTLRLGCVGPCSSADQIQREIHQWIGSPVPAGWDDQLEDEFLLNLDYDWDWRIRRVTGPHKADYDFSLQAGAGFGNYYVGANGGIVARVGHNLPDNYGAASFRSGGAAGVAGLAPPPGGRWGFYLFVGLQLSVVGRFLPTDGNTFVDGPRIDRDDLFGNLSSGVTVGRGRVLFSWTINNVAGLTRFEQSRADDFGTLSFSYYFK
ncbi:MAG TPA: lipid A deacylase LpxR family protein [Candidatus Polarisedimenticolaceae bacterium]|nr:lipid A deacylase LpxR family protein [Candidatus Polarisedimenticolaceae bacterium]